MSQDLGARPVHRKIVLPVVADADNPLDVRQMDILIDDCTHKPLRDVAAHEAARLAPYFQSMAERLRTYLATVEVPAAPHAPPTRFFLLDEPDTFPLPTNEQLTGGSLCRIFHEVAERSRNVVLSEVAIFPQKLSTVISQRKAAGDIDNFMSDVVISRPYGMSLGFIRVKQENELLGALGPDSVSVPIMLLPSCMLGAMAPYGTNVLLTALQRIATASNHDVMHHMAKPIVNDLIVGEGKGYLKAKDYLKWDNHYFRAQDENHPLGFESWNKMTHHDTWTHMRQTSPEITAALHTDIDTYFDELGRISNALTRDNPRSPQTIFDIVDVMSAIAGVLLLRIVPLNDPLMVHAVRKIESVCVDTDLAAKLYNGYRKPDFSVRKILSMYADAGQHYDDSQFSSLIRRRLVECDPDTARLLAPGTSDTYVNLARNRLPRMNLELAGILPLTVG